MGDLFIDTEWRSDWKWTRALPHLNEQNALQGAKVLDIGCGNAYHYWRAFGEGASFVLGVDQLGSFTTNTECVVISLIAIHLRLMMSLIQCIMFRLL